MSDTEPTGREENGEEKKLPPWLGTASLVALVVGAGLMASSLLAEGELVGQLMGAGEKIALYPLMLYVGGRKLLKSAQGLRSGEVG